MISEDRFLDVVERQLDIDLRNRENVRQLEAVSFSGKEVLQIVAGPGSGKTSVLVLRALRHLFVGGVLPERILITTFTRKAARELRTRWLDWGETLMPVLHSTGSVRGLDLNRCRIDTLDSIVQQTLTEHRKAGSLAPIMAESAASNIVLKSVAFRDLYRSNRDALDGLLARYTFDRKTPRNQGEALKVTRRLIERLIQDRVLLDSYAAAGAGERLVVDMVDRYCRYAIDNNVFDFATLAEVFLERLSDGSLVEWAEGLDVLLIDEYQDTNPLQEGIYFKVLEIRAPLAVTVVGDDDQSMYRFRGGSVELFTDLANRCKATAGRSVSRIDMVRNFRSKPKIVEFYNNFIKNDPSFAGARMAPPKPQVVPARNDEEVFPVLGMFRESPERLASDLADLLKELVTSRRVSVGSPPVEIRMTTLGDLGDIVFLSHSVEEAAYDGYSGTPKWRFPGLLRAQMETRRMSVFNARGQALRSIRDVGVLLGLTLLALDEDDTAADDVRATSEARHFMTKWRKGAQEFVDSNPTPDGGQGILGFIREWQKASSGKITVGFPRDWPVLERLFKSIAWIPGFQNQPEHQVWLEAVTRVVASAAMASPYNMKVLQNTDYVNQGDHVRLSRLSFVRDALVPIAQNEIDVDEEIMASVPRERLQFMTIHQSKGLEFPLVIVDVGSQFRMNHHSQSFLRFPRDVSSVVKAEDDVEGHLGATLRGNRSSIDRTFDDLMRLYYVAYSRPQSALMLVGCEKCLTYGSGRDHMQRAIPNVALFWRRDKSWPWRQPYAGGRAPIKVAPPFLEI